MNIFVTALIIIFPFLFLSCTAGHQINQLDKDGELSESAKRYRAGIRVTMHPLKSSYYEGEEVRIAYRIVCNPARPLPLPKNEVERFLKLFQNGEGLSGGGVLSSYREPSEPKREFLDTLNLTSVWSQGSGPPDGFYHLTPGRYSGYFDSRGIQSNQIEFIVKPPPRKLNKLWACYKSLRTISDRYAGIWKSVGDTFGESPALDAQQLLDSVWVCAAPFFSRSPSSLWRNDAVYCALGLASEYRSSWRPSDSLECIDLLKVHFQENPKRTHSILYQASRTIFKNLSADSLEQALIEYAENKYLLDYMGDVEDLVKKRDSYH